MSPKSSVWSESSGELGRFIRSLDGKGKVSSTMEPSLDSSTTTSEPTTTPDPGPSMGQKVLQKVEEVGDKAIHMAAEKTRKDNIYNYSSTIYYKFFLTVNCTA